MKKKKILIYIPTGLNTPELEILLSKAQNLIDIKNNVTIVTCSGGKNYYCSKNIYSIKSICRSCKILRNKGISKLNGTFKLLTTPTITQIAKKNKNLNYKNLIKKKYCNFDIGYGVYASYVAITRDMELQSSNAYSVCSKLLNTSEILADYFKNLLDTEKFNYVVLYNGRMNQYRPLFRMAQNKKINISNMEFRSGNQQTYDYKNFFSMDLKFLSKKINYFWNKNNKYINKKKLSKFYIDKYRGFVIGMANPFIANQNKDLLPKNWNKNKINIVYYTASNDELISYGKEYNLGFYRDQNDILCKLAKSLQKKMFKKYNLWIRMHPNLKGLQWDFVKDQKKLGKLFKNVFTIPPESKISSYKLMKKSDIVMATSSSSTIAEANFWNKPTITIGPNIWNRTGVSITPNSHAQLEKMIERILYRKINPKNSLKFAAFCLYGGYKLKYLKRDKNYNYYFNNYCLKLNKIQKLSYYSAKIIERLITKIFSKKI
jgi:hypothetical protein